MSSVTDGTHSATCGYRVNSSLFGTTTSRTSENQVPGHLFGNLPRPLLPLDPELLPNPEEQLQLAELLMSGNAFIQAQPWMATPRLLENQVPGHLFGNVPQ
jgi:hypothetical protein